MNDCVLYAIFCKSDDNIKVIDDSVSVRLEVVDINVFKYLYLGITNDFDIRMGNHKRAAFSSKYRKSRKFYNRLRDHGWDAYDKIILKTRLTREEVLKLEIEYISKYRSFELGLNSTPGGDGTGSGADHPLAQAVNVYNNTTGRIISFLWMRAADEFLGVPYGRIGQLVTHEQEQIYSPVYDAWFQARYAYDNEPFFINMPTHSEKIVAAKRMKIVVYNLDTKLETEYDGTDLAAASLGVCESNIRQVIHGNNNYFKISSGERYEAQQFPKLQDWKLHIPTRHESAALAQEKAVIAYDKDDIVVCIYDSITKAAEAERINISSISQCVRHLTHSAGVKNGHKLRWEYVDSDERAMYDRALPRKPNRPYYYIKNDKKIYFKTRKNASEKTRGKFAYDTQAAAITKSIKSNGTIPCKAGYFWFKLQEAL